MTGIPGLDAYLTSGPPEDLPCRACGCTPDNPGRCDIDGACPNPYCTCSPEAADDD